MSAPSMKSRTDAKAWLQELKSNRKTQAALGGLVLVLVYVLWPEAPKARPHGATGNRAIANPLGDRQLAILQKLPNLVQLNRAGELPGEDRMFRDLFLFDSPPPAPPPKPKALPPQPPPPPPTPEQIKAEELRRAREAEMASRPQALRFLGYMGNTSSGRLGAFMKGEETISLRVGDTASPQWKLMTITETYAEFQNLKFPDLRHRIEAKDNQASSTTGVTNEF